MIHTRTNEPFRFKRSHLGIGIGVVGVLFILAGQVLYWHDSILFPGYTPLGMPLIGGLVFPPPHFSILSYGLVSLFLLALAFISIHMRRAVPAAWCAFLLLILGLNCPLQIGFSQPSWLESYLNCLYQYLTLSTFAGQNSYPIGAPAIAAKVLQDVEGLSDRLDAAWISLRIGWTFHVAGSLLLLVGTFFFIPNMQVFKTQAVRAIILLVIVLAWNLTNPILGETYYTAGLRAERSGDWKTARKDYHLAIYFDKWNRMIPRVYQRLGALDETAGIHDSAEYHFQQGLLKAYQNDPEYSLQELNEAMETTDPDLKRLARLNYAIVATAEATTFASPVASPGSAAIYWQNAASVVPGSAVAHHYMAARGFQSSGQYKEAAYELEQAQDQATDVVMRAQIFSSIGDVDFLRGQTFEARIAYLNSQKLTASLTEYKNSRAMKALTDNAQQ